jgi:four helix bundle protein
MLSSDELRKRTLVMAVGVHELLKSIKIDFLERPIFQQLIKSSSAVAANYRAALRGRSDPEFYSKICIVIEECDETAFWLDYLIEIKIVKKENVAKLQDEIDQLVRIFSATKNTMKKKLNK